MPTVNAPPAAVMLDGSHLRVEWGTGQPPARFNLRWLRDHGEDEASLDPATRQRRVDTFSIPRQPTATAARVCNGAVAIAWADDAPETVVSGQTLARFAVEAPRHGTKPAAAERRLWANPADLGAPPRVAFDQLGPFDAQGAGEGAGTAALLANIHRYGLCIVDGVPATVAGTEAMAHVIAPPKQTIFGTTWPLSSEVKAHDDTAYSESYLEPHTDGTYYHDAAGLQMFNCLETAGQGGESIQLDGFAIAQALREQHPDDFEVLSTLSVPGHYIEPGVHLCAERPAVRLDAGGELRQLSFNNYDRAPFRLDDDAMDRFYTAYGRLHAMICDESRWLEIALRPGMTLIFDNWRMLHGRRAYTGRRVYHGCYHDHADFESRCRVTAALA